MRTPLILICLLACFALSAQAPRRIRIAAASDMKWALEEVKGAFEREHPGTSCALSFGSSGNFYAQLSQKAPFDLFLSADVAYAQRLADQGLGLKDTLFVYGVGRITLWVPQASPIPLEALGLKALQHPTVRKVAIANPKHAPYGRAAEAALKSAGILETVQPRLVLGDNISQTAQFVQTGHAEIGFIALSLAPRIKGRFWLVPQDMHPKLEQGGIVTAWAQDPGTAKAFRAFMMGPKGVEILKKFGFLKP